MNLSEQIKNVDLVALAESAGVELRQRGSAHIGRCPLHDERTPSFYIYPSNRFKCYGCHEAGDAADLIQRLHQCTFPEALRHLGINGERLTLGERIKIRQRQRRKALRVQRERDLVFTLSILIRGTRRFMDEMTPEQFDRYGQIMDELPAWEHYHQILSTGTKEERDEVIKGLRNMITIKLNSLFKPGFNYRSWLRNFLTGEDNATISEKQNHRS